MAQLFGQTEAPMMISMMPPEDHYNPDGSIATGRLSSAGRVGRWFGSASWMAKAI